MFSCRNNRVSPHVRLFGKPGHVNWQLGIHTVCSFHIDTDFLPLVWAFFAILIHVLDFAALHLRCQLADCGEPSRRRGKWASEEVRQSVNQSPAHLIVLHEIQTIHSPVMGHLDGIVGHITFRTIIFSSMLLIGTYEASFVILLFLTSAIVCRIILMFELSGMRQMVIVNLNFLP